jgi:hypothetical protein
MGNWNLVFVGLLVVLSVVAGCQQNERPAAPNLSPTAAVESAARPTFAAVTLSVEQLMLLDWSGRAAGRSTIVDKRIVGTGVEFDIRFPGGAGVPSMDYVSTGAAGQGALAGIAVDGFQSLALKFTLVSIGGSSDPNLPVAIAAGAVIGPAGDGRLSACEPVMLGFSPEHVAKVAVTPMHTERIRMIGIHAHVVNPLAWDPHGGVVTLRVEPAADAEILPLPVPAADSKSANQTVKSARTRSRSQSAKSTTSRSADKPRTKSPSSPTLRTRHIGAW